jgi:hypothetical protein
LACQGSRVGSCGFWPWGATELGLAEWTGPEAFEDEDDDEDDDDDGAGWPEGVEGAGGSGRDGWERRESGVGSQEDLGFSIFFFLG